MSTSFAWPHFVFCTPFSNPCIVVPLLQLLHFFFLHCSFTLLIPPSSAYASLLFHCLVFLWSFIITSFTTLCFIVAPCFIIVLCFVTLCCFMFHCPLFQCRSMLYCLWSLYVLLFFCCSIFYCSFTILCFLVTLCFIA